MRLDQFDRIARKTQPVELPVAAEYLDIECLREPDRAPGPGRLAGAHLCEHGVITDDTLDQYFDLAASCLFPIQAGMQHTRVIHDQQVARGKQVGQVGEGAVLAHPPAYHQQPACATLGEWRLGNPVGRQRVIEIVEGEGHVL